MKTANQVVDEIALTVMPPQGVAIVLTECLDEKPNWEANAGPMELAQTDRFMTKVAALQKSDPDVDWSAVSERIGERRRVAKWLSEVLGSGGPRRRPARTSRRPPARRP